MALSEATSRLSKASSELDLVIAEEARIREKEAADEEARKIALSLMLERNFGENGDIVSTLKTCVREIDDLTILGLDYYHGDTCNFDGFELLKNEEGDFVVATPDGLHLIAGASTWGEPREVLAGLSRRGGRFGTISPEELEVKIEGIIDRLAEGIIRETERRVSENPAVAAAIAAKKHTETDYKE